MRRGDKRCLTDKSDSSASNMAAPDCCILVEIALSCQRGSVSSRSIVPTQLTEMLLARTSDLRDRRYHKRIMIALWELPKKGVTMTQQLVPGPPAGPLADRLPPMIAGADDRTA